MSETKHTPGPWWVSDEYGTEIIVEAANGSPSAGAVICDVGDPGRPDARAELYANGELIAAAPDLLAALKAVEWKGSTDWGEAACCPSCDKEPSNGHTVDCQLAAAIRKAEAK